MATTVDPLAIRRRLGRQLWSPPIPHGPDGWAYQSVHGTGSIIVSAAEDDGTEWIHASIAYRERMPSYDNLVVLHQAVWNAEGYAYQVFAPTDQHVNIHHHALHLWGRVDGAPALPEFGKWGTI